MAAGRAGGVAGLYILAAGLVYNSRGWVQLNEIIRIPMIEYLAVFVWAGLVATGIWITGRVRKPKARLAGLEEGL